jgi:hypothetical protein
MENKTGKYFKYAIGEIILVMIGILLALQVNNWNTKRLEHIEEKTILADLKDDYQSAIEEFESLNAIRSTVISSAKDITLISVANIDNYPTTYLDSLFSKTLAGATFNNKSGSLNVLLTSGKINLVRNTELKKALIEWPGDIEDMVEDEIYHDKLYQQYQDLISDYLSWNDLIKSYAAFTRARFNRISYAVMPNNPISTSDYRSLLNNKTFFNVLHRRTTYCSGTNQETNLLIEKAEGIIKIIDNEL